jgi:hypothetical protein
MTTVTAKTTDRVADFGWKVSTPRGIEIKSSTDRVTEIIWLWPKRTTGEDWVPEDAVLEVPEVQEAIRFAASDFEEWKRSL